MRRLAFSLVLCLFLCGCSSESKEMDRAMALRSNILSAQKCSFEAEITADYGDSLHTFSMTCEADGQGNLTFTVTAPETISGIAGTVSDTGGTLTFEDTALVFPLLADDQLSPVSAPWILLKTLRSGYLTSACMEDALLRLTIDDSYEEDALHLDIWVDSGECPVRAEILYDGSRILSLDVKNFTLM